MTRLLLPLALIFAGAFLLAPASRAQVNTERDLTAVIALAGQPCGTVQKAEKRSENDWNATCSDGNRYRVYADSQGRARVEKR